MAAAFAGGAVQARRVVAGQLFAGLVVAVWLLLLGPGQTGAGPVPDPVERMIEPGTEVVFDDATRVSLAADSAPSQLRWDPAEERLTLDADGDLRVAVLETPLDASVRADQVILRDTADAPLVFQAGGDLVVEADVVDLFALAHPDSWLRAGRDLTIRAGEPVRGDARYAAGGSLRLEDRAGHPAPLVSPHDPIVLAAGDVSFASYTGASLHVVAGGTISIPGAITVDGAEPTAANAIEPGNSTVFNGVDTIGELAEVTLSDGTTVEVAGDEHATVDLRAGIDWSTFDGGPPADTVHGTVPGVDFEPASGATITTGAITLADTNDDGLVLITNQYRPTDDAGDITTGAIDTRAGADLRAGTIAVDSRGGTATGDLRTSSTGGTTGHGGDVTVLATDDLSVGAVSAGAQGFWTDHAGAGNVTLSSTGGDVTFGALSTELVAFSALSTSGPAGDIAIDAPDGTIRTTSTMLSSAGIAAAGGSTAGGGGDITLHAHDGFDWPASLQIRSDATAPNGTVTGRGGDVRLTTDHGDIVAWRVVTSTSTAGDAPGSGAITLVTGDGAVDLSGNLAATVGSTGAEVTEPSGAITVSATDGIDIDQPVGNDAHAQGAGATSAGSGPISLTTTGGPIAVGEIINWVVGPNAGDAGGVDLKAPEGAITVDGWIFSNTEKRDGGTTSGRGGDVTIDAGGDLTIGVHIATYSYGPNGIALGGGDVRLTSGGNIAFQRVDTFNNGDTPDGTDGAGDVEIHAAGSLTTDDISAYGYSANGDAGPGGHVDLTTGTDLTTKSTWTYSNAPTGTADSSGNVRIDVGGELSAHHVYAQATSEAPDRAAGSGGHVDITTTGDLTVGIVWSSGYAATHAGSGDIALTSTGGDVSFNVLNAAFAFNVPAPHATGPAGDITVNAPAGTVTGTGSVAAENATEVAGASMGPGGDVKMHARDGVQLPAAEGVGSYVYALAGDSTTTGRGGDIHISTDHGDITVGALLSYTAAAEGEAPGAGSITLTAEDGSIEVHQLTNARVVAGGTVTAPAGTVTLSASQDVRAEAIYSLASTPDPDAVAGDLSITATNGTVHTGLLRATSPGAAGAIDVTGVRVRVDGAVWAEGEPGSGSITIRHQGDGVVPFVVGDASVNGTADQIRTSDDVIEPVAGFLYSHVQGSIAILTAPVASDLEVAPAVATYGGDLDVVATLTTTSGDPIDGRTVVLSVPGRAPIPAVTDAGGVARATFTDLTVDAGSHPDAIGAVFEGDDAFQPSSGSADLTVEQADQSIDFPPIDDRTYGDAPFELHATASSGLPVTYVVDEGTCTVDGDLVTITGAGTCTITASQAGDGNHLPAPDVARSFTIAKAAATIELDGLAQTYDGTPRVVTATTDPTGLQDLVVTYDGDPNPPVDAGTYTVVATLDNADYAAEPVEELLEVAKATQTITVGSLPEVVLVSDSFPVTAEASSGLPVEILVDGPCELDATGETVLALAPGTCVITADQPGDTNHEPADPVTAEVGIEPIPGQPTLWTTIQGEVRPGDQVPLLGTGFPEDTLVEATLYSTPRPLGSVTAGPDGSFSTVVTIPTDTEPGTHRIEAVAIADDGARRVASLTLTVAAPTTPSSAPHRPVGAIVDTTGGPFGTTGVLPVTGAALAVLATAGAALVAVGGCLLVVRRRRTTV